jgi:hypothetical protein
VEAEAAAFLLRKAFLAIFEGRDFGAELFAFILLVVVGVTATTGDGSIPARVEAEASLLRNAFLACFERRVLRVELFVVACSAVGGFKATPPSEESLPE